MITLEEYNKLELNKIYVYRNSRLVYFTKTNGNFKSALSTTVHEGEFFITDNWTWFKSDTYTLFNNDNLLEQFKHRFPHFLKLLKRKGVL